MKVDYQKIERAVQDTIAHLRNGEKQPKRARAVKLTVVHDLEGLVTNGEFEFGVDAAIDAGGEGRYARPMDYVLGGMLSCQQMWCLRWAAMNHVVFDSLNIEAIGRFTWQGEYLDEVDAGLTAIDMMYRLTSSQMTVVQAVDMADTVARRCPVLATLRKAVTVNEKILLNDLEVSARALG